MNLNIAKRPFVILNVSMVTALDLTIANVTLVGQVLIAHNVYAYLAVSMEIVHCLLNANVILDGKDFIVTSVRFFSLVICRALV